MYILQPYLKPVCNANLLARCWGVVHRGTVVGDCTVKKIFVNFQIHSSNLASRQRTVPILVRVQSGGLSYISLIYSNSAVKIPIQDTQNLGNLNATTKVKLRIYDNNSDSPG